MQSALVVAVVCPAAGDRCEANLTGHQIVYLAWQVAYIQDRHQMRTAMRTAEASGKSGCRRGHHVEDVCKVGAGVRAMHHVTHMYAAETDSNAVHHVRPVPLVCRHLSPGDCA